MNLVVELHQASLPFPGYVSLAGNLPGWKKDPETKWLKNTPSQSLQVAVANATDAFIRFFKKQTDHPVFHKKGRNDTVSFPDKKPSGSTRNGAGSPSRNWERSGTGRAGRSTERSGRPRYDSLAENGMSRS
ncbi:MAG: hypothetical protein D084_Lepto4C00036G0009 [Leptospirillum sp. Group IV 'UBA BS']|nr:MAG: hypothetical protein D084_Lepto4C00036G0009 [Leptospirillum sp. Group IV 'UBA BS']